MSLKIRVYSDFVCLFCFIGEKPLMEAIQGKDVEIEWMPFELRPYPMEPMSPNSEYIRFSRSCRKNCLHKEEFQEALETWRFKDAHKQALKHAYEEAQVTAVPTFVIGHRMLRGLHTKEMLEKIILEQAQSEEEAIGTSCGIDGC